MKLRQKLAVVLAATMVATSVPVITMASTSNNVVKSSSIIKKDDKTTDAALKIKFEQEAASGQEFYLELENAEWLEGAKEGDADQKDRAQLLNVFDTVEGDTWTVTKDGIKVVYVRQSGESVRVDVETADGSDIPEDTKVELPLGFKAKGGAVSVSVKGEGTNGIITEGKYSVLTTGEKAATLTLDDSKTFYDKGELNKITLKESFLNSLAASGKDLILKIKVEDTDFEFRSSSEVKIKGTYGFNFAETSDSSKVKFAIDKDDKSTAYVWISKDMFQSTAKSLGRIEITGLKMSSDEKELTVGELKADITSVDSVDDSDNTLAVDLTGGAELDKDYDDVVVAKIANYGAYIEMKDSKAVDIVAGRDEETVFEVKESVDDVYVGSRTITLALKDDQGNTDKDFFMISKEQKADPMKIIDDDPRKIVESVEFVWKDEDDFTKNEPYKTKEMYRAKEIKVVLKDKDKDGKALNDNKELDKFKVKTKIYVPVDQQDKKTVEITGELRGVDEFGAGKAVNVLDPFDVTFDQTTLKVGLQNQAANKITLTEKDKEMLMKGKVLFNVAKGSKKEDGIVIEEKGKLTVTGDLKRTDFDSDGDQADKVTLKRQSKAASTLEISEMEVTVDRTVPEGYYDLELSGDAIDEYDGTYKVEKYIKIGTANDQDLANANGLAAATATFVIGESKYTVNGTEETMDAPAYIEGAGYTMIPMRYVSKAFGVSEKNIVFSNGTATIFAGSRTIQLTGGSDTALVNGSPIKLATKVVNKEGRIFVPVGEVANILGVNKTWDNTTKTATFSNVNTTK